VVLRWHDCCVVNRSVLQGAVVVAVDELFGPELDALPRVVEVGHVEAELTKQTAGASCGVHAVLAVERLLLFDEDIEGVGQAGRAVGAGDVAWREVDWNEPTLRLAMWLNLESALEAGCAVWPRCLSSFVWQ
jgi:hypothetical protein